MISIRKTKPTVEQVMIEDDIFIDNMVSPPLPRLEHSMGRDFNIILVVKEHAPKRIELIKKEVATLEKRLLDLGKEAGQLEALLNALK